MKRCLICFLAGGLGAALPISSVASIQAGVTTYPNFAAWNSAVTGVVTTQIPDPSMIASLGFYNANTVYFGDGQASVTFNGVVFSDNSALGNGSFFDVGPGFYTVPSPVLADEVTSYGVEDILVTFPSAVTGFAMNYGTFYGNPVTFALGNGDSFTLGSTQVNSYTAPDFVGATDTTPFTSVLVTTPDEALDLNNVSSGITVPEPSTCGLIVIPFVFQGFRLLIWSRKRAASR